MATDHLRGGRSDPGSFDDSMAAAIEDEMNKLLSLDFKDPLPADGTTDEARDRRRFFAAIARGVIRHLTEHPGALEVVFTAVPSPHATGDFQAEVQVSAVDVP